MIYNLLTKFLKIPIALAHGEGTIDAGSTSTDMPGMDMSQPNAMSTHNEILWYNDIQWPVLIGIILFIAAIYIGLKLLFKKARSKNIDILDYWNLRSFVKSRWYPIVFQIPVLIGFGIIGYYLFFGSPVYAENPGSILIWTFWWALLPFSFILVGRLWCAICPFALISDWSQKLFGQRKQMPAWLGKYSIWIIDLIFIFITWFDRVFGMTEHPILTGAIFLGLFAGAVICGIRYERRIFCRYICFLGNVAGNYSMVAPIELVPKNADVCKSCKTKSCFFGREITGTDGKTKKQPGCPFYQVIPNKDGNRSCMLCANCVKACPHDNVALSIRPFGSDFWKRAYVRFEESFFAKILVGIVIIQNVGMLSLWSVLSDYVGKITGITDQKILFTIIYLATMAIPVSLMFISSYFSAKFSKEKLLQNFARFGYAFIAVDLAGHLAHNLNHLLGEGKTIIAAISGIFSGQVSQMLDLAIISNGTIKVLQYSILIIGVISTFYITYLIAKRKAKNTKDLIKTMIPHLILLTGLMILNFYIFSLPMLHRA